jgi:ribonuclease VapC
MFFDASAVIATIVGEGDAASLAARLGQARQPSCRSILSADEWPSDRFGKGRDTAALNVGDCFAYACAQQHRIALLCKDEDFPKTEDYTRRGARPSLAKPNHTSV